MRVAILFVMLILTFAAVACGDEEAHVTDSEARFLALGDSYTIGESVREGERWPAQLGALLRGDGVVVTEPEYIARTGWTTDELASAIARANPQGPYALVTLAIGVNNQYRGRGLDEYRTQFRELLERAIVFAGGEPGRVVVLSIPDWGVTPFAVGQDGPRIARELDAFNKAAKEIAEAHAVAFVDVTAVSRQHPELVAGDGLHPSGAQYAAWARLALPAAKAALGRESAR